MRRLKVRHDPLPGIGEAFELDAGSGRTVTVVAYRSGRRDFSIGRVGRDSPTATVALSRTEAVALAALLSGTHLEITTTPRA